MNESVESFLSTKRAGTASAYRHCLAILERYLDRPLAPDLDEATLRGYFEHVRATRSGRTAAKHYWAVRGYMQHHGRVFPPIQERFDPRSTTGRPRFKVVPVEDAFQYLERFGGWRRAALELICNGLTVSEALGCVRDGGVVVVTGRGGIQRRVPLGARARAWTDQFPPPYPHQSRTHFMDHFRKVVGNDGPDLNQLRHTVGVFLVESGGTDADLRALFGFRSRAPYLDAAQTKESPLWRATSLLRARRNRSSDD